MIINPGNSKIRFLFAVRGTSLRSIWLQLTATTLFSLLVFELYHHLDEAAIKKFSLTLIPFTLIGLALSIFLGFRNNASYDRYWEGRKLWGQIINTSRTMSRQISLLIDSSNPEEKEELRHFQKRLVYLVIAYADALRSQLRGQTMETDISRILDSEEMEHLKGQKNIAYGILQTITHRLHRAWRKGWIHSYHLGILEQSLIELTNAQGGCERIQNTPLPFPYASLIHRLIYFYCYALPFGIVKDTGIMTPIVVFLVAYAFFGLEAISEEIEDPFGLDDNDLPLSAFCRTIEINLLQSLGERNVPASPVAENNILE